MPYVYRLARSRRIPERQVLPVRHILQPTHDLPLSLLSLIAQTCVLREQLVSPLVLHGHQGPGSPVADYKGDLEAHHREDAGLRGLTGSATASIVYKLERT